MPYFGWDEEYLSMVRSSIQKFCEKELNREYVRWMDENVDFPPDVLWRKVADFGYFARGIPEEYGGSGPADSPYEGLILQEEIATASVALMLAIGAANGFGTGFIGALGNEDQRREFLPKFAKGEVKMCMALTEPGGGTDILGSLRTTAVEDGNDYVLNGQKVFITAAHAADYIITFAITDKNPARRSEAWSVFLVPADSPGLTTRKIPKLGIHACACAEIFYEDVQVPKEFMLGPKNQGYRFLLGGGAGVSGSGGASERQARQAAAGLLNVERVATSLMSLGIAKAAYADAFKYSLEREAFGKPIGQFQIIQNYLVEMAMQIENARNMIYSTAALSLMGKPSIVQAQMSKVVAARASEYCAIKGMEILGGYGFTMEYDLQRHFRDYKQMVFAPITDEMAINVIARMLGLPKSY
ncbi:MAG: acyl-CoA dehydrogenase family protein [Deltaproteobacteria bacterium]|nr:acyl-CoA dehydrogenase family protein [Deltaproteobacteria bacterium]MBW2086594.1 acyl-CoA dehydrogenase family protein [Deltaproteobacteria bacterium]